MGKRLEQRFYQKRQTNGQQIHEKVLNITNYQGKTNQYKMSPQTCQNGYYKKDDSVGENIEKRPHLCTVGGKCKLVKPLQKTGWTFLKKLKIELSYDPAIPLLGI